MSWASTGRAYLSLDLGSNDSVQDMSLISLWGNADAPAESSNLRIYVSGTAFGDSDTYASLQMTVDVALMDVGAVDTAAEVSTIDRLTGIENLIGTALADNLTGDGNKNALFGREGNDSRIGTNDKVLVSNWFLGSQYQVEQIKSGENKTLLNTDVDKLVSAMAAFGTPSSASIYALPDGSQKTALTTALAANWH